MKAVQYASFGPSSVLSVVDVDRPAPKPGHAVVKVHAASFNPIDWKVRSGHLPRPIVRLPKTPGADVAGTIESPAPGGRFKQGDRVFGIMNAVGAAGSLAQYALVPESQLAPLPAALTFEQGAALPLALLTAWQALDAGRVGAGQKVLVTAAAGGVGSFLVPLAVARGATVHGTCSPRNNAYVTARGAASAIDYNTTDVGQASPGAYDVAIDVVGGSTEDASYRATKQGKDGRFVSIMNSGTSLAKVAGRSLRGGLRWGPHYSFVVLSPKNCSARLEEATGLIAAGKLTPPEIKVFNGLASAGAAMDELEGGHVRGKVVVKVAE